MKRFLRLLRAPNLLSVPGDPLAGFFLAAASGGVMPWPSVAIAAIASIAAYAGGMVDNDLVDLERDRRDRPERPLPSGDISVRVARRLRTALLATPFLLGVASSMPAVWFGVQTALLTAILAYNQTKAHSRIVGVPLMGLCRGLSLLSGAALLGETALRAPAVCVAFTVWTTYVAGLTAFATTENVRGSGTVRFLMLLPFALPLALLPHAVVALLWVGGVGAVLAGAALLACGGGAPPKTVQRTIGRLIRVLIPMQICACLAQPVGVWVAFGLVGCWLFSDRLSRRYAAS